MTAKKAVEAEKEVTQGDFAKALAVAFAKANGHPDPEAYAKAVGDAYAETTAAPVDSEAKE